MNKVKNKGGRGVLLSYLILSLQITVCIVGIMCSLNAAVFEVDTVDELRTAIDTANGNTDPKDTINLAEGTYTLTEVYRTDPLSYVGPYGLPSIRGKILIKGASANATIIKRAASAPAFRIFYVTPSGDLTLNNVTLQGGLLEGSNEWGGAILNHSGTLTVKSSIISGNTVASAGGGVGQVFGGTTEIINSTVGSNTSGLSGGGIVVDKGNLTIINSTITNNSGFGGGAIYAQDSSLTMTIINTTITGNSPRNGLGGGILGGGYACIINSTIFNNTGGDLAAVGESYKLQNTILGSCGGNCDTLISLGNNLIVDPECLQPLNSICSPIITQSTDLKGIDPQFDPFADNGTPGNGHFPLQSTSPAIDNGTNTVYQTYHQTHTDQLGNPRQDGPDTDSNITCDIGAIEYQSTPNRYRFVVMADSRSDTRPPRNGDPKTAVNETILRNIMGSVKAIEDPPPSFILFGGDLANGKVQETGGSAPGDDVKNQLNAWISIVDDVMGTLTSYAKSRIYPAFGSHERNTSTASLVYPKVWSAFSKVFDPLNDGFLGPSSSKYIEGADYGNTVYYLDYQNARFFVLNNDYDDAPGYVNDWTKDNGIVATESGFSGPGHEISTTQKNWVNTRLQELSSTTPLRFFVYHEPAYGVNSYLSHPGNSNVRTPGAMAAKPASLNNFLNVLQNNASMLFCGHEHHYARSVIGPTQIIDNTDSGANFSGSWITSSQKPSAIASTEFYQKTNYRYKDTAATANGTATWSFSITNPGTCTVYGRWLSQSQASAGALVVNSANNAPYTIKYNNTVMANISVDQSNATNAGKFTKITDVFLAVPGTLDVQLANNAESGRRVIADAVKVIGPRNLLEVKTGTCGAPIKPEPGDRTNKWLDFGIVEHGPKYMFHYAVVDVYSTVIGVRVYEVSGNTTVLTDYFTSPPDQLLSIFPDSDMDGVSDVAEGDLYKNNNTIAQISTAAGSGTVNINSGGFVLQNVDTLTDTDPSLPQQRKPPADQLFPYGLISMDILNVAPGATVPITLTFPSNIAANQQYWKYSPITGQWITIPSTISNNTITISLTNGGTGDADGDSQNSIIKDPGGLGAPKPEVVNDLVTFTPIRSTYTTTSDTSGCTPEEGPEVEYKGQFSFDATLTNKSNSAFSLSELVVEVTELTNDNVLQNADGGPGGVGARLTVSLDEDYADGVLSPGQSVNVHFIVCLTKIERFTFFVDVLGFKEAISAQALAEPQSTGTEPRRVKLHKKGFFGRFRPR